MASMWIFCDCGGFEKSLLKQKKMGTKNQYPVAAPSSSITLGMTLCICLMYFLHFAKSTVSQKYFIPSTSSSFFLGFASLRINSFNSCQRFSIGFKSGDSAGVRHQ